MDLKIHEGGQKLTRKLKKKVALKQKSGKELADDLYLSSEENKATIDWVENIVKDTEEKKPSSPSIIMEKTRNYGIYISPEDKKKIKDLLRPFEFREFGNPYPYRLAGRDFMIWLFGTIEKFQDSRGRDPRFTGTLKLHKLIYFVKNYKLMTLFDFQFQRYPYGVFSEELRDMVDKLKESGIINSTKSEDLWNEDKQSMKYNLTPQGNEEFREIETDLSSSMEEKEFKDLKQMCEYLYGFTSNLLGKTSKYHFTRTDWEPFLLWCAEELVEQIITSLPSHLIEESLKEDIINYFKSEIQNILLRRTITEDPLHVMNGNSLMKFLRMATIGDVFFHDEYFLFGRDKTPTNYVFPVELYRKMEPVREHLATEIINNISPKSRTLVVLYDGLCWDIAKTITNRDQRVKLYGPIYDRITGKATMPQINQTQVTILTDTVFTGRTVLECIEELKKRDIAVQKVLSCADRECGLRQTLEDMGIESYSILNKDKLSQILMPRWKIIGS